MWTIVAPRLFQPGLLLFFVWVPMCAEAQSSQEIPLRVRSAIAVTGEFAGIFMMPLKCNSKGDIYVRGYQPGDILAAPVVKFSNEGKRVAAYSLRSVSGFEKAGDAVNFEVTPRGEVFLLVTKSATERGLVRFHEDGRFDKYIPLDAFFDPNHIAAFSTGELLITGIRFSQEKPTAPGEPLTALFDRSGRLLRELRLEGDVNFEEKESAKTAVPTESGPEKVLEIRDTGEEDRYSAVTLGAAFAADDGNVYLLRAGKAPLLYQVTAGGETKPISIPPPREGFRLLSIKVAGGRAVLALEESGGGSQRRPAPPRQLLSLVDLATGEKLLDYVVPAGTGAFACYSPDALTFLGSGQNQTLTLKKLTP